MKKIILAVMAYLSFNCAPLAAQVPETVLKDRYEKEAIQLDGNWNRYCKNTEWMQVGITGQKIEKEFGTTSPETKQALKSYRKHRKKGVLLLITGGAVMIAGLVMLPIAALAAPVSLVVLGTGLVPYYSGAFHLHKARRGIEKAVWLRNRDVLVMN